MISDKDFRERMDRLEELAGKAMPGRWAYGLEAEKLRATHPDSNRVYAQLHSPNEPVGILATVNHNLKFSDAAAEFIAAANPAMIKEMIAELKSLQKKLNDKKAHIGTQAARIKMLEDNLSRLQEAYRKLDKEADWLASRVKCDNRFTPAQEAACIIENGPCVKCLRKAAERAVTEK